ncbi:MAG: ABC transporter ATP-binding protein [Capsulimonadaceae bacterium]|nr:ABC transporter ATP-binding protein [Capsulimonadaceae bacterium]
MNVENAPPAIEVNGLVKDFRIYHRSHGKLKALLAGLANSILGRNGATGYSMYRALDNVTFDVPFGQAVALIGHNGSGKTTLLSVLSRVYLPTAGYARLNGPMISLLELGAGFHGELTAEENVFFTGAIRGLSEEQVRERYNDIVDFAELKAAQMDLPVRMFSSGMHLRLAFAVSVNMDADILLIDEGLAVGDEAFQEKCFRKIEEFKAQGKTLVIVTHELDHAERLADRVLWLERGRLIADGATGKILGDYRRAMMDEANAAHSG